jgi:hypothetical protein
MDQSRWHWELGNFASHSALGDQKTCTDMIGVQFNRAEIEALLPASAAQAGGDGRRANSGAKRSKLDHGSKRESMVCWPAQRRRRKGCKVVIGIRVR